MKRARNGQALAWWPISRDLLALERTRKFKGQYHVLAGLNLADGDGSDQTFCMSSRWLQGGTARTIAARLILALEPRA